MKKIYLMIILTLSFFKINSVDVSLKNNTLYPLTAELYHIEGGYSKETINPNAELNVFSDFFSKILVKYQGSPAISSTDINIGQFNKPPYFPGVNEAIVTIIPATTYGVQIGKIEVKNLDTNKSQVILDLSNLLSKDDEVEALSLLLPGHKLINLTTDTNLTDRDAAKILGIDYDKELSSAAIKRKLGVTDKTLGVGEQGTIPKAIVLGEARKMIAKAYGERVKQWHTKFKKNAGLNVEKYYFDFINNAKNKLDQSFPI